MNTFIDIRLQCLVIVPEKSQRRRRHGRRQKIVMSSFPSSFFLLTLSMLMLYALCILSPPSRHVLYNDNYVLFAVDAFSTPPHSTIISSSRYKYGNLLTQRNNRNIHQLQISSSSRRATTEESLTISNDTMHRKEDLEKLTIKQHKLYFNKHKTTY